VTLLNLIYVYKYNSKGVNNYGKLNCPQISHGRGGRYYALDAREPAKAAVDPGARRGYRHLACRSQETQDQATQQHDFSWRTGWRVLGDAVRLAVLYPVLRPGGGRRDRCNCRTLC